MYVMYDRIDSVLATESSDDLCTPSGSFNPLADHIWLELYSPPSDFEIDIIGSVSTKPGRHQVCMRGLAFMNTSTFFQLFAHIVISVGTKCWTDFPVVVYTGSPGLLQLHEHAGCGRDLELESIVAWTQRVKEAV